MNNNKYRLLRLFESKLNHKYAKKTIVNYIYSVEKYLDICSDINLKSHDKFISMKKYIENLKQLKYSDKTINTHLTAVKLFYKIVFNNYDKGPYLKTKHKIKFHSEKEIEKIISECKNPKHKLSLVLAYGSGLTLNEIVNLQYKNINIRNKVLKINEERIVPIDDKIVELLINEMNKKHNKQSYVFTNSNNIKLNVRSIQKAYNKACEKTNTKILGISSLRNSFAIHLLHEGTDIKIIQKLLGHKNIITTKKQFKHIKKITIKSPVSALNKVKLTNNIHSNAVCDYCNNENCNICKNYNKFKGILIKNNKGE